MRRLFLIPLLCLLAFSQAKAPERHVNVEGSYLVSDHDPKVKIELNEDARYMGADRWNLYDVADCEVHAFVDGSRHTQKIERLYWIQFEQYLPEKADAKYEYDSPRKMNIGGLDFYVDTWVRSNGAPSKAGSDREHVEKIIADKGWKMPAEGMMYTRLVYLPDSSKRKELMIIYGEYLEPYGLTAADLDEGGKAHARWPELEKGMLERLQDRMVITPQ